MFNYEIVKLRHGSDRFGPCEVCGEWCQTMVMQNETRDFAYRHNDGRTTTEQTYYGCDVPKFGHEDCLISVRKQS